MICTYLGGGGGTAEKGKGAGNDAEVNNVQSFPEGGESTDLRGQTEQAETVMEVSAPE